MNTFHFDRNAHSGAELSTLEGHRSNVFACDWAQNGSKIVSASRDKTLKVWYSDRAQVKLLISLIHFLPISNLFTELQFFLSWWELWMVIQRLCTTVQYHQTARSLFLHQWIKLSVYGML